MSRPARRPSLPDCPAAERRLDIARRIAGELSADPAVVAVLAVGSVARGRCSADSDLDLAVLTDTPPARPFESRDTDGVTVDLEWLSIADARRVASPPRRDLKALRDASRLGNGWPAFDRGGVSHALRAAAAALVPDEAETRAHIEGAYRTLIVAVERLRGRPAAQWDALRGVYDSVAHVLLQLRPERFQKPKWVVQDLVAAGEPSAARGLLEAYGARGESAALALRTVAAAEAVVEAAAAAVGDPGYRETLALGFTEVHAGFSFVCRCVEDARSLIADGATAEGEYVAKFAARLAVVHVAARQDVDGPGEGGLLPVLDSLGEAELSRRYGALFPEADRAAPGHDVFQECLRCLQRCGRLYRRTYARPPRTAGAARPAT